MAIWQSLLRFFGLPSSDTTGHGRTFSFDQELVQSLQFLAEQENRPAEQVAADLLAHALEQRQASAYYLQRWGALTRREQQVAALICQDYTNRQIAAQLSLSPETIKTYSRGVLVKFSVRSKAELRQVLQDWDFSAWLSQRR